MFIKSAEEFEHFVAKVFELSRHHAEVTQASGDYGVDLVLNGEIAVQVKFYGTAVGPAAVQEVVAGRKYYKCTQAWVVTNSTYTPAAVTLAQVNDVRLIDGNELAWLAENPDDTADHGERYRAVREVRATFGMGAEDDFFDYEPNRHFGATTFTVGGITITRDQIERMSSRERNSFLMALTREQFEAFQDAGLDMGAIPDRSGICSHCGAPVYYTPSSPSRSLCAACEDRIQKLVQAEEQVQIRPAPAPAQGPPPPTQAQAAPSAPPGWYYPEGPGRAARWWDGQSWR